MLLDAAREWRLFGIVTLIELAHARDGSERRSRWPRHVSPRHHRRHAEMPVLPSRDQVTLRIEVILGGSEPVNDFETPTVSIY